MFYLKIENIEKTTNFFTLQASKKKPLRNYQTAKIA